MSFTLNVKSIQIIRTFTSVTKVDPLDFFEHNGIFIFLVPVGFGSKAIGQGGKSAKAVSAKLKKQIKIIEFGDKLDFLRKLISPLSPDAVKEDPENSDIILVESNDRKTKALLIGRNASNLRSLEEIMRRHFSVQEIKVI